MYKKLKEAQAQLARLEREQAQGRGDNLTAFLLQQAKRKVNVLREMIAQEQEHGSVLFRERRSIDSYFRGKTTCEVCGHDGFDRKDNQQDQEVDFACLQCGAVRFSFKQMDGDESATVLYDDAEQKAKEREVGA